MSRSGPSHWAQIAERGSMLGIRILVGVFRLAGPAFCRLCMQPVLLYFYMTNRASRVELDRYLTRLVAHAPETFTRPRAASWRIYRSFGASIVDRLSAWTGRYPVQQVRRQRNHVIADLERAGQGAVLMVSHLGNFEMSRVAAAYKTGSRYNIIMHTRNSQNIIRAISGLNESYAVSLIQADQIDVPLAMSLSDKIEAGEFLVIAGDRAPANNPEATTTVDFLGHPAALPVGPYILSRVLQCPLITVFCLKDKDGYRVSFDRLSDGIRFNRTNREAVLQQSAQAYARLLETHCLQAPLQWYNFHPFWSRE